MVRLAINSSGIVKVVISKGERINYLRAKKLLRKSVRIANQNNATSMIIEIDNSAIIYKDALIIVEKYIKELNDFSVVMIKKEVD